MEASKIAVGEQVPASRKLQASDAAALLGGASRLIAMKGKKVEEFDVKGFDVKAKGSAGSDEVAAMLGPTGNLRAPTIRSGKTILVGFNEEVFSRHFG